MSDDPDVTRSADLFSRLWAQEYRPALKLAVGLLGDVRLAEEAVQEAFEGVRRHIDRIDGERLPAYLTTAVLNQCRSVHRRDRARKRRPVRLVDTTGSVEQEVVDRSDAARVRQSLDRLPFRQRQCLVLRYYADLSDSAIAEHLGISSSSVKTHIRRGLDVLLRDLGGENG